MYIEKLMRHALRILFGTLFCACAHSAPYVPDNEATILEHVPVAAESLALAELKKQVREHPGDLESALELAHAYLLIGRENSDPRFVSYAQATLSPWSQRQDASSRTLVLAATAYQSSHRFDEALTLLDRALARDAQNAQAWLTKATILQVRGEFPAAREACRRMLGLTDQLIAMTCLTGVESLSGRLDASYRTLAKLAHGRSDGNNELRSWVEGQLAEMAVRLGDFAVAEQHFLAALQASPEDVYLKGAYADLLLAMRREDEVLVLLKGTESHDVLLLRLAIAGHRLRSPDGTHWAELFEKRRLAARSDDSSHLREHARFLLEVRNDAEAALSVARRNWRVQREPSDVRVYLRSAAQAGASQENALIRKWIEATGYEDRALVASAPPAQSAQR